MKEDFMLILSEKHLTSLIKKTNEYTVQFGLCLTDSDIHALVLSRRECLSEQQRIEFDESILDKLIFAFCDSDYICQDNYAETIARLQRIFYLYKTESMD